MVKEELQPLFKIKKDFFSIQETVDKRCRDFGAVLLSLLFFIDFLGFLLFHEAGRRLVWEYRLDLGVVQSLFMKSK